MARFALLVLLLANIGYFAWSQGWLRDFGLAPEQQNEPQRIAQQIRPEALRIVSRESDAGNATAPREPKASSADVPAAAQSGCLQAGPFDAAEAAALEPELERALPESRWRLEPAPPKMHWIVQVDDENADTPAAGRRAENSFVSEAAARMQLETLAARGVKSAQIVQRSAAPGARQLTLPEVDAALRERLPALEAALAGRPLEACDSISPPLAKPQ